MTESPLTPEAQAAKDRAFLDSFPVTVRTVRVPVAKLLKRPLRYLRGLPPNVVLVGVNTLGTGLVAVSRDGTRIAARGQDWALQELLSKIPQPPAHADPE